MLNRAQSLKNEKPSQLLIGMHGSAYAEEQTHAKQHQ